MAPTPRRRRLLRTALLALPVVVVLLAAGGFALWRLTWMAPAWWSPVDPADEQTAELAQRVEYRLVEEAHKPRAEPEPWWIEVKQDQLNAWLAARLPEWIAHEHGVQWPAAVGRPQVNVSDGGMSVGVDVETNAGTRYVVAHLAPTVANDTLSLGLEGLSIGRAWVPGAPLGVVLDQMRATGVGEFLDDPGVEQVLGLLEDGRGLEPMVTLGDGRRVRVLAVRCDRGALLLQAQTVRP
jgi:hypothetical protein